MKAVLGLLAALAASPTAAEECAIWQSELHEYGERVAYFDEDGLLILEDKEGVKKFATLGAGTGIPWRAAQPVDGKGKELAFIEHKGALIIDMEVFEPACVE